MKIPMADGSIAEVSVEEYAKLVELGLVVAPPPPVAKTQAERLREVLGTTDESLPLVKEDPNEAIKRAYSLSVMHDPIVESLDHSGSTLNGHGNPPRGFSFYLPVTKFERDAVVIMRSSPHTEWSSAMVSDEVSATGEYRKQLMAAVSKMCRGHRGVERGRDNVHYLLDEFGRDAVLIVFNRPSTQWDSMRRAAEAGRDWRPSKKTSKLIQSRV